MEDEVKAESKTKVVTATRAAVGGFSPLALLLALPQPYSQYAAIACAVLAGAGLAATQIPLPADQSGKLWFLYRALNFLALNWQKAANAAMLLRGASSQQPKVGPGSSVAIKKDTP